MSYLTVGEAIKLLQNESEDDPLYLQTAEGEVWLLAKTVVPSSSLSDRQKPKLDGVIISTELEIT